MSRSNKPRPRAYSTWWLHAGIGMVLLLLLLVLPGCFFGVSANPFRIGNLPAGDIVRTHAKPPLGGYYRDFDPDARTLSVKHVGNEVNPVRTQHVLIVSVCDEAGNGLRNRRVEWHLDGPGHFVEVDESGFFAGRGYLVDNHYAVSYTNYKRHTLTLGTDDPNDDIQIQPGETWCVITSAVEGATNVTVYAPGIYNWQDHKKFITKYWVDVVPVFPNNAVNRTGQAHPFTTQLVRISDGMPAPGYRVRYRIVNNDPPAVLSGGPVAPAVLAADGQMVEVISNELGQATAVLSQVSPTIGANQVSIELLRPKDRPTDREMVIFQPALVTKNWIAPNVQITKTATKIVRVGGVIEYTITVQNTGNDVTQGVSITDTIPETLEFLNANPEATSMTQSPNGQPTLDWRVSSLAPGQAYSVRFNCRALQPVESVTNVARARLVEGGESTAADTTRVITDRLSIIKRGPERAVVGQPIDFELIVQNTGEADSRNLYIIDTFPAAFESFSGTSPLRLQIGDLQPNETRTASVRLIARREGRWVNQAQLFDENNVERGNATAEVEVLAAQLEIGKGLASNLSRTVVGQPVNFNITVRNVGPIPASNILVRDRVPPQLQPLASGGAQVQGNTVTWDLGTLQPGEDRNLLLETIAIDEGESICNLASVSSAESGEVSSPQVCVAVSGVTAYLVELLDRVDAITVGDTTLYGIKITNQGTKPVLGCQITATVPPEMEYVRTTDAEPGFEPQRVDQGDGSTRLIYPPVPDIPKGYEKFFQIEVRAKKAGSPIFQIDVKDAVRYRDRPIIKQEGTTIFDPNDPATLTQDRRRPANPLNLPPLPQQQILPAGGPTDAKQGATPTKPSAKPIGLVPSDQSARSSYQAGTSTYAANKHSTNTNTDSSTDTVPVILPEPEILIQGIEPLPTTP